MIYFDHSATTPLDPHVLKAMQPYFLKKFGNSSSLHSYGQEAARAVDKFRAKIAKTLNCEPDEIIFTSGSTEANNLAIKGLIMALKEQGVIKPHIITSMIEHSAIIEPCRELVKSKQAEVTYLKVKSNGVIDINELKKSIKDNTVLVTIMYANSEVGSMQPIKEIGKFIKDVNKGRVEQGKLLPIYFHSDATQAVNFATCDTKHLNLDMMSLSGHKIYGPKGVGALYAKNNIHISALQRGGHHERNLRSGTLNVPGIVGLGAAVVLAQKDMEKNNKKIVKLRDYLVDKVKKNIPDVVLNTDRKVSLPSHAHFSFLGVEGEAILIALDLKAGIAVSTGSACASSTLDASHVLLAMGIKKEIAHNAIRFTLGKNNTKKEIDTLIKALKTIVKRYREMAPELG
ncbi:MAG: cysteine desulfurase family protein [bacterium]